jgi:hypothetical protein
MGVTGLAGSLCALLKRDRRGDWELQDLLVVCVHCLNVIEGETGSYRTCR